VALRKHAFKKGQVGNPTGSNGRHRAQIVAAFLDEPAESDPSTSKLRKVLMALYTKSLRGSEIAGRTLVEHALGKPAQRDEVVLALAEHFRQVERDRIELALKLLGERANEWDASQVREFLQSCARDPRGFMQTAEEYSEKGEGARAAEPNSSPKTQDVGAAESEPNAAAGGKSEQVTPTNSSHAAGTGGSQ
jgi:hypothetical protein